MTDVLKAAADALITLKDPAILGYVNRRICNTYGDFVTQIQQDMNRAVEEVCRQAHILKSANENIITNTIIMYIRGLSYNAHHEASCNGNVDIHIEHMNFLWLAEAKIFTSYATLLGGFYQLTTRYSRASPSSNQGCFLIYIKTKAKTTDIIAKWKGKLAEQINIDADISDLATTSDPENLLSFFSEHTHRTSGLPYKVLHLPVNIYFEPKDGQNVPKAAPKTLRSKS